MDRFFTSFSNMNKNNRNASFEYSYKILLENNLKVFELTFTYISYDNSIRTFEPRHDKTNIVHPHSLIRIYAVR
jgi:hypothetical protein